MPENVISTLTSSGYNSTRAWDSTMIRQKSLPVFEAFSIRELRSRCRFLHGYTQGVLLRRYDLCP